MFSYRAFIDELRILIVQANTLAVPAELSEDPEFRRWRQELTHLIAIAREHNYTVHCGIKFCRFNILEIYESVAMKAKQKKFQTDLSDTLNELEVIVASFDKFGVSAAKAEISQHASVQSILLVPEKVTLAWLWRNMSVSFWSVMSSFFSWPSPLVLLSVSRRCIRKS